MRTNKTKNEIDEIRKWGKIKRKDIKYIANKYLYDFQQFEIIMSFGDSIYTAKINIDEAQIYQGNLLENIVKFDNKSKQKTREGKAKKRNILIVYSHSDSVNALYEGRESTLNAFESGIIPVKVTKGEGLKILSPKHMLQRLKIALVQVKASNASENLLNEIRQIRYSLYQAKEFTKK